MNSRQRTMVLRNVLFLLASMLVVECASAQTIVVPRALESVEGLANNNFPFNLYAYLGYKSQRYQQVYAASEFADAGGPIIIQEIVFRPDGPWGGPFSATLPNVQINLSTSDAGPDNLSPVFENNIGADETTVFSGQLPLSSTFSGPANGPKVFDIRIVLTTPFRFDFREGNLLLDVRNFDGGELILSAFDASYGQSNNIAYVYTYTPDGVNDPEGVGPNAYIDGLVTQFVFAIEANPQPVVVPLDIKPRSCPNPWNVNSEGVLPAAILGTQDLDVAMLDPASIHLAGVKALRHAYEDVATPSEPFVGKTAARDCSTGGPDGFLDLTVKFDSHRLLEAIQTLIGRVPKDGEVLLLPLTGKLKEAAGGTEIVGEDVLLILKKGKK